MSNQALIRRNDSALSIAFTEAAESLKNGALEASALVCRVNDAGSQETAVQAQQSLQTLLSLVEKARKEAKDPVLTFGRAIDDAAKTFVIEVKQELLRITQLVGDFQVLQQQRARAAQQAENERLTALERERAVALANAQSHDQVDKIQEDFSRRAELEAPVKPIGPVRAQGQVIRDDWDVTVSDIHLLYRAHPGCVKIEPLIGEIKSLLKAGVKVAGVIAKPLIKAGVKVQRQPAAIEV